jgi:hypothetical protein
MTAFGSTTRWAVQIRPAGERGLVGQYLSTNMMVFRLSVEEPINLLMEMKKAVPAKGRPFLPNGGIC